MTDHVPADRFCKLNNKHDTIGVSKPPELQKSLDNMQSASWQDVILGKIANKMPRDADIDPYFVLIFKANLEN
jgi:hypothetical protein